MRFRIDPRLSRPVQPFCAPSRCHRQASNLHAVRRGGLSSVCIPVPSRWLAAGGGFKPPSSASRAEVLSLDDPAVGPAG